MSTELLVQKELRSGKTLESLLEEYCLKADCKDGLVLLNYDIKSMKSNPIVQECRSLILEEGTWDVISMAFPRFFNSGEGTAAEIDWSSAHAQEKVDGSLIQLYWYGMGWRCATRGKLDAAGPLPDSTEHDTFGDLVWELLPRGDGHMDRECCYVFELVSPWNRIVTVYKQPKLYLLTIRNMRTLIELPHTQADEIANKIGFRRPKRWDLSSLEEVVESTTKLGVTEEGFVVCDGNFNRIKVKSVSYLTIFNMFNGGQPDFWNIILTGEDSEFLTYFPEYKQEIEGKCKFLEEILESLERTWEQNKDEPDQKTFALAVKDLPGSALLFSTRKKGLPTLRAHWDSLDHEAKKKSLERISGS